MKVREITIYDLANELKLSTATISRALKDDPLVSKKTRKRIFELAEKMGYRSNHFARNLRSQKTNTIGFMVHELQSSFINSVLAGVEKIATAAGYDLIIAHSSESYDKEVANANNLFHKRVDGLIASLSFDTRKMDHFRPFTEKSVPVIFFDRVERNSDYSAVIIDNHKSGYQAARHLIEQGCRRIAHVTSSLVRNVYAERFSGYRSALEDYGITYDESLLIVNDLSEKAGIVSAEQILAMQPRPDGIFITNDFVAAACMLTLKTHNIRIPEDIAVVGFNNDAIGHLIEPALTTINYPGEEMGEVAARTLIDHLNGSSNISNISTIIINSGLIVRRSSLKKGVGR
ncbi:MAG: LacI family DNA-binding transcriptional regulator [Chitinophagaceae bacterium]|nr:LacI family DNA-binding transcriptional regulator [Chitinophagaceae bacterium]MCW5928321.1 LacI family DNA-binding transcriptional regulator [Chitinophagaceae bacterium]